MVEGAVGLHPGDHVCWAYEDDGDLLETLEHWAADGIANGERILYVAERPLDEMRRRLGSIDDLDDLLATRRVLLDVPSTMYGDGPVDDRSLLTYYATATADALADGCTGLRVAAEITDLPDGAAVDAFVAWEQLADELMNRMPMSALCAFDRRTVSDSAIAAIAAAHPSRHGPATGTSFVLHAHDDGLRLAGEVETFDRFRLESMLRNAASERDSLVLHLDDLELASGGCTAVLHAFAKRLAERGGRLVLKGAPVSFREAWSALGFTTTNVVFA